MPELSTNQEEADTRMVLHAKQISNTGLYKNVVIRSNDTDVFIILLTHASSISSQLWLDAGLSKNNTCRNIDITKLAVKLGNKFCSALCGFHAFTGCDFTSAFMRKGKAARPLTVLEKNPMFVEAFAQLGEQLTVSENLVNQLQKFVCAMYNKPIVNDVNEARLLIFRDTFAPKNENEPMAKTKGTDPSHLPPCHSVLIQKIYRTNFVSYIWKKANVGFLNLLLPQNNGWQLKDNLYSINWYEGSQVPESVCNSIEESELNEDDNDDMQQYNSSSDESEAEFD